MIWWSVMWMRMRQKQMGCLILLLRGRMWRDEMLQRALSCTAMMKMLTEKMLGSMKTQKSL